MNNAGDDAERSDEEERRAYCRDVSATCSAG
jgi:hypothetical protein